ncbi:MULTISPECIES: siderophore biosynthesis protein PvsA [unclassified Brenneria]|uniref:siderophore biosynthesis protein PvsA n=1 Tax=unclassified Brenneria TaxID=2634434 RepID=UPI00155507C4|nr:siderophore biosynthesis protein PvsA [Brenneria sp. hezel4-2-4]MEE3649925.1 siderophore biosynthesis protein PvsA [Brenneria sp. HEZEL_4_2_4]NPC99883.1 siderophore biosynthesis protein PvsA [Brenneria sp. hezel4-2-4]
MPQKSPLVIVSHVVNAAVTEGFIPAARQLGFPVLLLTDQGMAHNRALAGQVKILECDVFNPLAILDTLTDGGIQPAALFSNSDHLQTAVAIAAEALGLPGKDWRICYAAKEKWRMRQRLTTLGLPSTWSTQLLPETPVAPDWPWPLVVKPSQGVASMDVSLIESAGRMQQFLAAHPARPTLLLEQFIAGPLFTLETLGDGQTLLPIGGFDVELSPPPHFVETRAVWQGEYGVKWRRHALEQLRRFGVGFGVCHSEFIATPQGPVLVEINYRSIGDGREFLLDRILPGGWFTPILQLHLGQPVPAVPAAATQALIHYLVAGKEGTLHQAPRPTLREGVRYRPLKTQGERITLTHSNKDYLGVLYVEARDSAALRQLEQQTLAQLRWEIA